MADNPTSDKPAEVGRPIEAVLDDAALRARELSEGVGVDLPTAIESGIPEIDAQDSLDAHFDEIEALLSSTADEIGEANDAEPDAVDPEPVQSIQPGAEESVGDEGAGQNDVASPVEDAAKLDDEILQSAAHGDEANPAEGPVGAVPKDEQTGAAAPMPGPNTAAMPRPSVRGVLRRMFGLPVRCLRAFGSLLAAVLDVVDKPFGRISYDVRYLCGWAALVTLIMAGVVITFNGGW